MVHERQYIFLRLNLLIDMFLAMLALVAAYYTRSLLAYSYNDLMTILPAWFPEIIPYEESHLFKEYLWLFPACAILWPMALNRWGYYDLYDFRNAGLRRNAVIKASAFCGIFLVTAIFVFKQQFIARIVIAGTAIWATVLLILKDKIIRAIFVNLNKNPEYFHNILIVTELNESEKAKKLVEQYKEWGLRISNELDINSISSNSFTETITQSQVDEVIFAVKSDSLSKLTELINICEQLGIKTIIFLDVYKPNISVANTECLLGIPMLTLSPTTRNFGALTVKVFFDRVAALFLLIILSPLLIIIYLAVKLTSKGPAIYKQQRCGINGKKFTFYKFRSMYNNAANVKSTLLDNNEMEGWAFKIKNDPRITTIGKFIRRFSFDELPQLWNVLKGDMSLVGPRPALPDEVEKFKLWERRRLSMKPGMTGLWQVSGRNQLPNDQWVVYDLKYIDNWSLMNDIKIIFRTLLVIIRGDGM